MKNKNCPEVIASVESINSDGDDTHHGEKIVGIQVRQSKDEIEGAIDIDIREFPSRLGNIVIRIPYKEFQAALAEASLNADRDIE